MGKQENLAKGIEGNCRKMINELVPLFGKTER
jgi:hypothetical protein